MDLASDALTIRLWKYGSAAISEPQVGHPVWIPDRAPSEHDARALARGLGGAFKKVVGLWFVLGSRGERLVYRFLIRFSLWKLREINRAILFPVVVFDDEFEVQIATNHRQLEEILECGTMVEVQGVFDSAGRAIAFTYRDRPQPSFTTNVIPAQLGDVQRYLRGDAAHAVFPARVDRPVSQDLSSIIEEFVAQEREAFMDKPSWLSLRVVRGLVLSPELGSSPEAGSMETTELTSRFLKLRLYDRGSKVRAVPVVPEPVKHKDLAMTIANARLLGAVLMGNPQWKRDWFGRKSLVFVGLEFRVSPNVVRLGL